MRTAAAGRASSLVPARRVRSLVLAEPAVHPPSSRAGPVLRAGFTDVLVTGMLIRWMSVRQRPMATGASMAGARLSVAPRITKTNISVMTISVSSPEARVWPPGERAPKPFEASPPSKPGLPVAIM